MAKKKDNIKDAEIVPSTRNERVRSDRSIVMPAGKSDSEMYDQMTEALGGALGTTDIVIPDKRSQVAALTVSDLNPTRTFDKKSPVLMVWDDRSNQWTLFRSLDEVGELFSECDVYVALPQHYKKLKRGFSLS